MPTTYYHTVNGAIIGESTGGVRTDYHRDALGSVVATTDQNQNVTTTARYAAYGTPFATTGDYATLRFGWCGSLGYRKTQRSGTGLAQNEAYVQRRHYSTSAARWTTADPLEADANLYGYGRSSPIVVVDPSGNLSVKPAGNFLSDKCWHANRYQWDFELDSPAAQEGYFVQEVHVTCLIVHCKGDCCDWLGDAEGDDYTYWEAWPVNKNEKVSWMRLHYGNTEYTDYYECTQDPKKRSCGEYTQERTVIKFFFGSTTGKIWHLDGGWQLGGSFGKHGPCPTRVGDLYAIGTSPINPDDPKQRTWFDGEPDQEKQAERSGRTTWRCCGGGGDHVDNFTSP